MIWPGSKISFHIGLVHPLSSTHTGLPVPTCNFLLMHQAHMVGVPSGTTVGCKVDGHQPKAEWLSSGKSSMLLFVLSTHGDTCGPSRRFYSTVTTNQWLTSGERAPHERRRPCHCCACCTIRLHIIILIL